MGSQNQALRGSILVRNIAHKSFVQDGGAHGHITLAPQSFASAVPVRLTQTPNYNANFRCFDREGQPPAYFTDVLQVAE